MKMSEAFPSRWVQASELKGDTVVTIHSVTMELIGQPAENLPVVSFVGTEKGLVLNKTNGSTIAGLLGDDTDSWGGKQITLYPTVTDFGGKTVPCIRVRSLIEIANQQALSGQAPVPPAEAPPAEYAGPDSLEDSIPF